MAFNDNNNGKITAPVSVWDVKEALSTNESDVGLLCVHGAVNKWAKYKPIRYPKLGILTDSERKSRLWGFHDPNSSLFPIYSSLAALNTAVVNGEAEWPYLKPTGGLASPYRLQDFNNYVATCNNWGGLNNKWDIILGGTIVFNRRSYDNMSVKSGDMVCFNVETDGDGELGYGDLLKITDFFDWEPDGGTDLFSDWYGGLYFHDVTYSTYHKTILDTTPIGQSGSDGIHIMEQIYGTGSAALHEARYRVIPFAIAPWAGMPAGGWSDGNFGTGKRIISFNGASFFINRSSNQEEFYDNLMFTITSFTQANGSTTVEISYTNNRSSAYTITEAYLMLVSEKSYDDYDNPWDRGWNNKTDVAFGDTTYYSQLISDQCYTADVGSSLRKRYGRTEQMLVSTIPANSSGILTTVTIPATADDYGTFDVEHSVFLLLEFSESVMGNGNRLVY